MRWFIALSAVVLLTLLMAAPAWPVVRVTDDAGRELVLDQPARRIVSLAPFITELLFAAGAGAVVVGVSEFSDYPDAARHLPRIGGGGGLDLEAILALRPDLVIAWQSGNPSGRIRRLQQLGLSVFISEPHRLSDVMSSLERFGRLAGTDAAAQQAARSFRARHEDLRRRYSRQEKTGVFYQVWDRPLMTVNGQHLISDVIRLCGGRNVFADLPGLAPQIDIEAVLASNPEIIVAGGDAAQPAALVDEWRRWPELAAVKNNHLYSIQRELLVRHTPRILDGAEQLCRILEEARKGEFR